MQNTTLKKIGAAGGIAFVVLQPLAQGLIQIGGAEPSFNAPAQEILDFFISGTHLQAHEHCGQLYVSTNKNTRG